MPNTAWLVAVLREQRFTNMPDADVLAVLNARVHYGDLSTMDVENYMGRELVPGGLGSISYMLRYLGLTGTPEQQAMVQEVFAQLTRNTSLSLDEPNTLARFAAQCDALIAANFMTAEDKTELLNMGMCSEAEKNGGPDLELEDIAAARREIGAAS